MATTVSNRTNTGEHRMLAPAAYSESAAAGTQVGAFLTISKNDWQNIVRAAWYSGQYLSRSHRGSNRSRERAT